MPTQKEKRNNIIKRLKKKACVLQQRVHIKEY
jgi:hypothetical protein